MTSQAPEKVGVSSTSEVAKERMARLNEEALVSAGPTRGFFRGTWQSIRDLGEYRELLGLLVRRELKARYKDSALGFLWSLLRPIAILLVYYVAIGKFLGAERSIPSFAIYVFAGLTAWQLFTDVVAGGTGCIVGNAGLIKKVYLPREVFPLSVLGSGLFTFSTQFAILVLGVVVASEIPTGSRLLFVPLSLLVIVVYATALALVLSAVNVYLRDVQYLVEIGLTVLFWSTPVVYSWALVQNIVAGGWLQQLYLANPMAVAIMGMQRGMWVAGTDQPFPDGLGTRLLIMLGIGLVLVWLAQRLFARLEANFAQEL
ncbi:ABC transporter permease [Modestobacter sp. VKM Ac-2985]|uniref:ABC transporter permease n=1 Tax=Modestobacter sp. VKM Ac-2985 TaxID=3004139 RepID=UPI0022AB67DC|nr:ABC transporter permease [Modestobacter sp. VKM Ac-2985]MCZ2838590.1 ABC transporter permease [Modestobacter sp. VKM Ac-2985]